jgi:hypothetical protein
MWICRHSKDSNRVDMPGRVHSTIVKLARSGQSPVLLLRECGLADNMLEYLPSLLSRPIQYYSCFISYSTTDQFFADRLYADLQAKGVRCWFAPHTVKADEKIRAQGSKQKLATPNSGRFGRGNKRSFQSAWYLLAALRNGKRSTPTRAGTRPARSLNISSPISPTGRTAIATRVC